MITDQELDKGLITMKFIWFAMLFSLAIYLIIALMVGDTIKVAMEPRVFDVLRTVFYILSMGILIATGFIRRLVLAGQGRAAKQPTPALNHPLLQKYVTAMLIALALSESVGIFGFILFLLGKNPLDLYILIALSAAAMIVYRPRKDELLALIQEEQMKTAMGGATG